MKTREDYDRALSVVRAQVVKWDPYSLIAGGAPATEFDNEIASIVKNIPNVRSARDLTRIISAVFCDSFGAGTFPPAECEGIGNALFADLRKEALL